MPITQRENESDRDFQYRKQFWKNFKLGAAGVFAVVAVLFAITLYSVSTDTVPQDSVGVVVGGGPFDPSKKKVKGDAVEQPGRIVHGTYDKVWTFPSAQAIRFQDYEVNVTTKDGKTVTLKGQLGFRFGAKKNATGGWVEDSAAVMAFAKGVGARPYGEDKQRPGESNDGWTSFLNIMVLKEINAAAKQSIGNAYCADFEPSCRVIDPRAETPATDPDKVYDPLAASIEQRVTKKLAGTYFADFRVTVQRVNLTSDVEANIQNLASEQAKTKAAEQAEKTAEAEANAIRTKGKALQANKSLVGVEIVKACGDKCTVIVDGSGNGVPLTRNVN